MIILYYDQLRKSLIIKRLKFSSYAKSGTFTLMLNASMLMNVHCPNYKNENEKRFLKRELKVRILRQ